MVWAAARMSGLALVVSIAANTLVRSRLKKVAISTIDRPCSCAAAIAIARESDAARCLASLRITSGEIS